MNITVYFTRDSITLRRDWRIRYRLYVRVRVIFANYKKPVC